MQGNVRKCKDTLENARKHLRKYYNCDTILQTAREMLGAELCQAQVKPG
jgi:hypothetical protein